MQKRTKIVCTLGPACESVDMIEKMVQAGMNVARLNFSHGTHENHAMLIQNIREVSKRLDQPVAILQDLQGPKIRIGTMPQGGVELKDGETVVFDTGIKEYTENRIPLDYEDLHTYLKPGERILISDGKIETKISSVSGTQITATVTLGGIVTSHKGINLPDSTLKIRAITEKDKQDAQFGVEHRVDFIALSFVRTKDDILFLRNLIEEHERKLQIENKNPIRIIAKIERPEALKNIESILEVVDGIMVARGDLGIETPAAEVPVVQKRLIALALQHTKPVIVATQMLDSMQENLRPTRAEVSDVANAVIDHTDAVMLSNETATGKYPVETVQIMSDIICETEKSEFDTLTSLQHDNNNTEAIIGEVSKVLAERSQATAILSVSLTGQIARIISSHRPEVPILVATPSDRVMRQLNLSWGVRAFHSNESQSMDELVEQSLAAIREKKWINSGEEVVVVCGVPGKPGEINRLEVQEIK